MRIKKAETCRALMLRINVGIIKLTSKISADFSRLSLVNFLQNSKNIRATLFDFIKYKKKIWF